VLGIPNVTIAADTLSISINKLNAATNTVIDFAGVAGINNLTVATGPASTMTLTMDGTQGDLIEAAGNLTLGISGFFTVSGGFAMKKATQIVNLVNVTSNVTSTATTDMLSIGLSNVSAFVGVNGGTADAMGLNIQGVSVAVAMFADQANASHKWTAVKASASSAAVLGIPGVTIAANSISVAVNKADTVSNAVIDFAGAAGANNLQVATGPTSFQTMDMAGETVRAAGNLTLSVSSFFSVSGGFAMEKSSQVVNLLNTSTNLSAGTATADMLTIGLSNVNAFVGANGGTADAMGIDLQNVNVALAMFSDQGNAARKWVALKASAGVAAVLGIPDVTISANTLSVVVNQADVASKTAIDFSGVHNLQVTTGPGSIETMDMAGAMIRASGNLTLSVSNFFSVSGGFAMEKGTQVVNLLNTTTGLTAGVATTDMLTIGMSNLNAFAGVNGGTVDAMGIDLQGVNMALAMFTDQNNPARKWVALKASAGSAAALGIPNVTIAADTISVAINKADLASMTVIDFAGANNLQVLTGPGSVETMDMAGELISASGNLTLAVSNYFSLSGGFGMQKGTTLVTLTDNTRVSVDMLSFAVSNVNAFVGINGGTTNATGLNLTGVSMALAMFSSKTAPSDKWVALQASAVGASILGVSGVTMSASNVTVEINKANSMGKAINFQAMAVAGTPFSLTAGTQTFSFGMSKAQLSAAATLNINLFDFLVINGSFAIEQGTQLLNLSDGRQVTADKLTIGANNLNAFVGLNGNDPVNKVGFDLVNVNFALALLTEQGVPSHKWTALRASVGSAAFLGIPNVVISSNNLFVEINKGYTDLTGKVVVADFATTQLNVATGPTTFEIFNMSGNRGELLRASGIFNVNIFDSLQVSGAFAIESSTQNIVLSQGALPTTRLTTSANTITMTGAISTAFVGMKAGGVNPIGFDITGLNLGIAMMTDVNDPTRSWASAKATAQTVSMNVGGVVASGTNIDIGINLEANDGTTVDYSQTTLTMAPPPGVTTPLQFNIAPSVGNVVEISGTLTLDVMNFFSTTDFFSFRMGFDTMSVTSAAGVTSNTIVTMLKVSKTGFSAFAGVSGVGLDIQNVDVGLAFITDGTRFWVSLEASATQVAFSGIKDVTVSATNVRVKLNSAASDGSAVNYVAKNLVVSPTQTFSTMQGEEFSISGVMDVNLFGFFTVNGAFSFSKSVQTFSLLPTLANPLGQTVITDELMMSAAGVNAFVGVDTGATGRVGFSATGVDFALIMATDKADLTRKWTALKANVQSAAFEGIPGLGISATTISVSMNMEAIDKTALDFSAANKSFTIAGVVNPVVMDMSVGNLVELSASMNLDLFGFTSLTGSFAFKIKLNTVTLNNGSTATVSMLTLSDATPNVFAGINGGTPDAFGFNLSNASFGVALIVDMLDPSRIWVTAQAKVGVLNFVSPTPIVMKGSGVSLSINTAANDGTVVDYVKQPVTIPAGLGLNGVAITNPGAGFTFDINGASGALLQVSVANALLAYDNYLHISGSFAFTMQSATALSIDTGISNNPLNINYYGKLSANDQKAVAALAGSSQAGILAMAADPSVLSNVKMKSVVLAGSNINVFVGLGPYFQDSNGDGVYNFSTAAITINGITYQPDTLATDAMGFELRNGTFGLANYKISKDNFTDPAISVAGLPSMTALKVTADSLGLVGISFLKASAQNISFEMNTGSTWNIAGAVVKPTVDFLATNANGVDLPTGGIPVTLNFKGEFMKLQLSNAELQISNFVYLSGNFAFSKGNAKAYQVSSSLNSVPASVINALPAAAQSALNTLTTVELGAMTVGATNVNLFVGLNGPYYGSGAAGDALGLYLSNVNVAFAMLKPTANNITGIDQLNLRFQALKVGAATAGIVGLNDLMSIKVEGILVELNQGSSSVTGLDPWLNFASNIPAAAPVPAGLAVDTGGAPIYLDYSSKWIRASVDYAEISVSEFLSLSGSLAFTMGATQTVNVNLGELNAPFTLFRNALPASAQTVFDAVLPINNGATSMAMDIMTIGGSNLMGFAGIGGPYRSDTNGDGRITVADAVNPDAIGLAIDNVSFAGAILTPNLGALSAIPGVSNILPKFISLQANAGMVGLVGMDPLLSMTATNLTVNINTGYSQLLANPAGAVAALFLNLPNINYATSFPAQAATATTAAVPAGLAVPTGTTTPPIYLDFAQEIIQAKVGYAEINVAGMLQLYAGMSFTKRGGELVTLTDGSTRTVTTLSLAITNAYGFMGVGNYWQDTNADGVISALDTPNASAVGVAIQNLNLGAIFMQSLATGDAFMAASVDLSSASLVGLTGITLSATSLALDLNAGLGVTAGLNAVDFSKSTYSLDGGVTTNVGYFIETGLTPAGVIGGITLTYSTQLLNVKGVVQFNAFSMASVSGAFEFKLDPTGLTVFMDGQGSFGPAAIQMSMAVSGVMSIGSSGLALKLNATRAVNIGTALSLNASFVIMMNTTGKDFVYNVPAEFQALPSINYSTVTVPAQPPGATQVVSQYVYMEAVGSLNVMNGLLTMNGDFTVLLSNAYSEINVFATVAMPVINPLAVTGTLGINTTPGTVGVYGSLEMGAATGATLIDAGFFSVDGSFLLQFNTTSAPQNVRALDKTTGGYVQVSLPATSLHIAGSANITVAGFTTLKGTIDITLAKVGTSTTFKALADLSLDIGPLGAIAIGGGIEFFSSPNETAFALDLSASVGIGIGPVAASGTAEVQINTSLATAHLGVAANTYKVLLGTSASNLTVNAATGTITRSAGTGSLKVIGYDLATFGGSIGVVGGVFEVRVDQAKLDFFSVLTLNMTGYFRSDGNFSITGTVGFNVGFSLDLGLLAGGFDLSASLSVTISNTGFAASASGSFSVWVRVGTPAVKVAGVTIIPAFSTTFSTSIAFGATISVNYSTGASVALYVDFHGLVLSTTQNWNWGGPPAFADVAGTVLTLRDGGDYSIANNVLTMNDGSGRTMSLAGINTITGSAGNDRITLASNAGTNGLIINSGGGDDIITLNGGTNSTVNTGIGNDQIIANVAGTYNTGSGNDKFDSSGSTVAQSVDMGTGNNVVITGTGSTAVTINGGKNSVTGNGLTTITNTKEGFVDITMNGASSNLTVNQTVGMLNIGQLSMGGGTVILNSNDLANGGIVVDSTLGTATSTTMTAQSGNIDIRQVGTPNAITGVQPQLSNAAIGSIGVTSLSATKGYVTAKLDASTLDITALGDVNISELNDVTLNSVTLKAGATNPGANVTIVAAGNLTSNATVATSGAAVIDLQATTSITLNGALTTVTGHVTMNANAITLTALGDITSTTGDVVLNALAGALTMADGTLINAGSGLIKLDATGNITLGKLTTTNGADFLITSTAGAIMDAGDITAPVDITATTAKLILSAANGIGGTGAIETNVASLTLSNSAAGGIGIIEFDNLLIDIITQSGAGATSVSTLNGAITLAAPGIRATTGQVTLHAQGLNSAMRLDGAIKTSGGGIALTTDAANMVFAAGLEVLGAGNIDLLASQGAIVKDRAAVFWLKNAAATAYNAEIDWVMSRGKYAVNVATGEISVANMLPYEEASHLANGTILRPAGGIYIQTTQGAISMYANNNIGGRLSTDIIVGETATAATVRQQLELTPLSFFVDGTALSAASTTSKPVSILIAGNVAFNAAGLNAGNNMTIKNLTGTQSVTSAVQGNGQPIILIGSDANITALVQSIGANIYLSPIDPTQSIVLGNVLNQAGYSGYYSLYNADLANLANGFNTIVVGSNQGSHIIQIGDLALPGSQVFILDPLLLQSPMLGGAIFINSDLIGTDNAALTVDGSGHTTTFSANVSMATNITINDSVIIDGAITLTASTGGIGSVGGISLGNSPAHLLNGNGDAIPDTLTLVSNHSDVKISAAVGGVNPLDGLTINGATNVTFDGDVATSGDIIINATGNVVFNGSLNISNGSLIINGPGSVTFKQGANVNGNILIEGNEIDFLGGQGSIAGTGNLTLRTALPGITTEVGSLQTGSTASALNLTTNDLLALRQGFSSFTIGHATTGTGHASALAGAVLIGSVGAFQTTFNNDTTVYGRTIAIQDYSFSSYTLKAAGNLTLDAISTISIYNTTEVAGNLSLYSATGSVAQFDNLIDGLSGETLKAVQLNATTLNGLQLGALDTGTIAATNLGSGDISIHMAAATTAVTLMNVAQTLVGGSGNIIISSALADISVAGSGVITSGTGSITLNSGGALLINQQVLANAGAISLTATADFTQNMLISSIGSAINVTAGGRISMADGVLTRSSGVSGSISYQAVADMLISKIETGGSVTLNATSGAISDGLTGETANILGGTTVASLSAANGVGNVADNINLQVASISGAVTTVGGFYLQEADALMVAGTGISTAGSDGNVVVTTIDGALTINGAIQSSAAIGNILLQSQSPFTQVALALNAAVSTTRGNISAISAGALTQAASSHLLAGGSIDLQAAAALLMSDGATAVSNAANIRYNAALDLTISGLSAVGGSVSLIGNRLLDAGASNIDVTALALRISPVLAVASALNPLETNVGILTAQATSGGIFISDSSAIQLGQVAAVTVNRVTVNGGVTALTDAAQSDVLAGGNGSVAIRAAGNMTLQEGGNGNGLAVQAIGSGNLLLQTLAGDLIINSGIDGGSGHISLLASGSVNQLALITTSAGTIDVSASTGAIVMAAGAKTTTVNQNIQYSAGTDLTLTGLDAGVASISLLAGGQVIDGGDLNLDILAGSLLINAGAGVGQAANALDSSVTTLAASVTSGGLFLNERAALVVDNVAAISINRVTMDGLATVLSTAAQSDLTVGGAVAVTTAGAMTINEGLNGNGFGLSATGNVLLDVRAGDLLLQSAVAGGGSLSLFAANNIVQAAAGSLSAVGTIDLQAMSGAITMADGATTSAVNQVIRYRAATDITLGGLDAGSAAVSLIAGNNVLDGGDLNVDVIAADLRLIAAAGAGQSANAMEISVANLSASVGGGGLYLNESDALSVGRIAAISVNRVAADGTVATITDLTQSDIVSRNNGAVILNAAGTMTLNDGDLNGFAIQAAGTGGLLLNTGVGDIVLNSLVDGGSGHVSIVAAGNITQTAAGDINTSGIGTIDLQAIAGSITMADGATANTLNQNIRYSALGTIMLAGIDAGIGAVSLIAGNSIVDGGDLNVDVVAGDLRINAAVGAGQAGNALETQVVNLTAVAGSGGLFISEADALSLTSVAAISINRVGSNGVASVITDLLQSDVITSANGAMMIVAAGSMSVNDGNTNGIAVQATGSGDLLLQSLKGDLLLNSAVDAGAGNMSMIAAGNVTQAASAQLRAGGTVDLQAVAGAITILNGAATTATNKNIRYQAGTDISLSGVNAGTATVSLLAAGRILDSGDLLTDIVAGNLRIQAGMGAGSGLNGLDTSVVNISASVGSGGLFINEADTLTVTTIAAMSVQRVGAVATLVTDVAQSDLLASANGAIVVNAGGSIIVNDGDANLLGIQAQGVGNVLLNAGAGGIVVNTALDGGAGSISLVAAGGVSQSAAAVISTTGAGTIDVAALSGAISMANGAVATTTGGDIRYTAALDLQLGELNAVTGHVGLVAGGSIVDGDLAVDVRASGLSIQAGGAIGSALDAVDTAVDTISASAGAGGLFIAESNALTVGGVVVYVDRVAVDGQGLLQSSVLSDLTVAANGALVLTAAGSINITDGLNGDGVAIRAQGSGSLLLNATTGGVTLDALLDAGSGNVSLLASTVISQGNGGSIATSGTGTIDLQAGGSILMFGAASATANADVRYVSGDNLMLGLVNAGAGRVMLQAVNSIIDTDVAVDVIGSGLLISAGGAVGSSSDVLETSVGSLSVSSVAGGQFIDNATALNLTLVSNTVKRVLADATSTLLINSQADMSSGGNGSIVVTAAGTISVNDGDTNQSAVRAMGTGNVLLHATLGDVVVNSSLDGGLGNISVIAAGNILQAATGDISSAGTIDLQAMTGSISMADGATSTTLNQNIRYAAAGDVMVAALHAGTAAISIVAGASVIDGGDIQVDVIASSLRVDAVAGAGQSINHLDTSIMNISAKAGSGGIFVSNSSALTVTSTGAININRVGTDGFITLVGDVNQSDLVTSANGAIVLSAGGTLTVNDGDQNLSGVLAAGTGGVLLIATSGDVLINSTVDAGAGHMTLLAAANVQQSAAGSLRTSGLGTIDVEALAGVITMADGAITSTVNQNIRYYATGTITLAALHAGVAAVSIHSGGALVDGGDLNVDVIANDLRMNAVADIGMANNRIETSVVNISAVTVNGGLFIAESDALTIGAIAPLSVNRLASNGIASLIVDQLQQDLVIGGNGAVVINTGGTLTVNSVNATAIQAGGGGNLLLQTSIGDIIVNAAINAGSANLSLIAAGSVTQSAAGDLIVNAGGSIDVEARTGAILMADGAISTTLNGAIRYASRLDMALGGLSASSVSLIAGGSIVDAGDLNMDIVAANLRLNAMNGAGQAMNALDIQVSKITSNVGQGGLFINAAGSLNIDGIAALTINRVAIDGSISALTDAAQSDVVSFGGVILNSSGSISLLDGLDGDGVAIQSVGTGHLLLNALNGDVIINALLQSAAGHVSVQAGGLIHQSVMGSIVTSMNGTIDLQAGSRIEMVDGASSTTANQNIRYQAGTDIVLTGLSAGTGSISLLAGGNIIDAGDLRSDLQAANLRIQAQTAIGSALNALELDVGSLTALSGSGGIYLLEADALIIDGVADIAVNRVAQNMTISLVTDLAQSDIVSSGTVKLSAAGALTLNDGLNLDGIAVQASGTGDLLLNSGGDIVLTGRVDGGAGNVSVLSAASIQQGATGALVTTGQGTLDLEAAGSIVMSARATASAGSNISYVANGADLSVATINSLTGNVNLYAANSVLPAAAGINVTATGLNVRAANAIGSAVAPLTVSVSVLSASAGSGAVFINKPAATTVVSNVVTNVNRVLASRVWLDEVKLNANNQAMINNTDISVATDNSKVFVDPLLIQRQLKALVDNAVLFDAKNLNVFAADESGNSHSYLKVDHTFVDHFSQQHMLQLFDVFTLDERCIVADPDDDGRAFDYWLEDLVL